MFLVGAEFGLLNSDMMDLNWWLAHAFEVAGIGLVGIPAALDLRHSTASRALVGDLQAADLVADEAAFLGGRVHALMLRLAEKDPSTEGHTRRVATLAVQLGEQLHLPADRLRLLALGGLLHDMGKLSIPDAILNKPGKLTDEEFDVIRSHPGAGRELLTELGGFPPLVLDLVESHHERLDGRGYPNRADAGALDLEVRILTVADVYDALTADRVYRDAWPAERAFALARRGDRQRLRRGLRRGPARRRRTRAGEPRLARRAQRARRVGERAAAPAHAPHGVKTTAFLENRAGS